MRNATQLQSLTRTALLTAIAIAIPMFMPIKVVIEPASYTLASHVPVFIAMFISMPTAVAVAIGSTFGFFLGGFPLTVVARAASHVIFSLVGGLFLSKYPDFLSGAKKTFMFNLLLGILHGGCELLAVVPFYVTGQSVTNNFFYTVVVLVGFGTVIHSMVDFCIALAVCKPIGKQIGINVNLNPTQNV